MIKLKNLLIYILRYIFRPFAFPFQQAQARKNKGGYILLLTLLITSAAIAVVTYIFNRGTVHIPFSQTMIKREKAKMLAIGGVELAIAKLAKKAPKEEKRAEEKEKKTDAAKEAKHFLTNILPAINRWEEFSLDEEIDGTDGTIKICLMSEEGKININNVYDFEQLQFVGEKTKNKNWKILLQEVFQRIEKGTKAKDLFQAFEKFLKSRQYKVNDVTELLTIKEFEIFKNAVFYEPLIKKEKEREKQQFYLTDIFTTWSSDTNLDPWLFSDSINGIFGLPRASTAEVSKRKEQVSGWLKEFKLKVTWNVNEWKKYMVPVYGKELRVLPKNIESILSDTFAPKMFSVLSYGTVGAVTQRLFAILERTEHSQNGQIVYDVKIKKLYWL